MERQEFIDTITELKTMISRDARKSVKNNLTI